MLLRTLPTERARIDAQLEPIPSWGGYPCTAHYEPIGPVRFIEAWKTRLPYRDGEARVYAVLSETPLGRTALCRLTGLGERQVQGALYRLQRAGLVARTLRRLPVYRRNDERFLYARKAPG